ncbi:MAG: GvpL/GvpF family gas vesicle protein [Pseudomonadota bacterium]
MIYLYGFIPPDSETDGFHVLGSPGIGGTVSVTAFPGAKLIYSDCPDTDILPKRRFLLLHTKILEAFSAHFTVLPMRFGMIAESVDQIADMVSNQRDAISKQFTTLSGLVEFNLKIDFPHEATFLNQVAVNPSLRHEHQALKTLGPAGASRFADFGRRLGESVEQARAQAQDTLARYLEETLPGFVQKNAESPVQVINSDLLIERGTEDALAAKLNGLAKEIALAGEEEPTITLIGPEPPFSFVSLTFSIHEQAA